MLNEMARDLGALLKERGETVAVSESSSGGLVSAALLSVPGASAFFLAGAVVYTGVARNAFLDLSPELPPETRSSSEPYALLCAQTVRAKANATWGLAETGAAGPSGNRYGDSAGHTCVAIAGPAEAVLTVETRVSDREANMWMFARAALELLTRQLRDT